MQRERRQLGAVLPHLFGYRLLQIGDWGFDRELLATSATLCHWLFGRERRDGIDVVMNGESLPVTSRCLDAVILPHSLEVAASPHRLLREVDRVLCDHGQVVILGFNPYAPWLWWCRWGMRGGDIVQHRRCYPLGRIRDWLDLLDFEVVRMVRYGLPYLGDEAIDERRRDWRRLPAMLAPAYLLVARKRVVPVSPLPGRRRRSRSSVPAGMPEPTPRLDHGPGDIVRRAA